MISYKKQKQRNCLLSEGQIKLPGNLLYYITSKKKKRDIFDFYLPKMYHCVKQSNKQHYKHTFLSINLEWKYSLANDDITLVKNLKLLLSHYFFLQTLPWVICWWYDSLVYWLDWLTAIWKCFKVSFLITPDVVQMLVTADSLVYVVSLYCRCCGTRLLSEAGVAKFHSEK